ncbi:transposase [Thalassoroseus pseudoceratinae]|uniref:transposase n=1 Tax=Thalassoroseus pseudoceratinae TaxID=2713176 RepID=UPI00141E7373|nr:transposase [Thalassoroseus pseudoceratinae]
MMRFSPAFTQPTACRMLALTLATIITIGHRTLSATLMVASGLLTGHCSTDYRLFSRPAWSTWSVGRILADIVIELAPPVELVVDDRTTEHPGRNVWGKAKHRDAVRSSHSLTKWIWGHKWVVLAVTIRFPWPNRPWALPVLFALHTPQEESQRLGRKHRTAGKLARILIRRLLGWFPERRLVLTGGGQSPHTR